MALLNRILYTLYKKQRTLYAGDGNNYLFLRDMYCKFIEPRLSARYPLITRSVMISITRKCQCSCPHCGTADEPNMEMDTATIKGIIDDMSSNMAPQLYLFGGEPLLHPDLLEIIAYAKRKPLFVTIDTNGILLDENKVRSLKDVGIDLIRVSIDSHVEASHDQLRGCSGVFGKAVDGIKICRDYSIPCHISTYATQENLVDGGLKGVIELGKTLDVPVRILSPMCAGKWANASEVILSPAERDLLKGLLEKNRVYWEQDIVDTPESVFKCFGMTKFFVYVSTNGDIQPCCYLPTKFGNIYEEPFQQIVKTMHKADMFTTESWCDCGDCPANVKEFRDKYLD